MRKPPDLRNQLTTASSNGQQATKVVRMYDNATLNLMGLDELATSADVEHLTTMSSLGFREALAEQVLTSANVHPNRDADLGCGLGNAAILIARRIGSLVAAFDIAHELLSEANRRANKIGVNRKIVFVQCDLRRGMPVELNLIDLLIISAAGDLFGNLHDFLESPYLAKFDGNVLWLDSRGIDPTEARETITDGTAKLSSAWKLLAEANERSTAIISDRLRPPKSYAVTTRALLIARTTL